MRFARHDMFLLSLFFQVISHVSGSISVTCGSRYIFIYIEGRPLKTEFLHANGFYIGRRDSRCYANLNSRVIVSFPFRKCDMKVKLYEGGVVYSNTIFFDAKSGKAEKYAEFQCQYGATDMDTIQSVKHNKPPVRNFNGSLVRDVTLCNSLRYCPSRSCPTSLEFHDHTVFFDGNVMHMAIFTNAEAFEIQGYPESVSAIEQLSMQCIDGTSSSSPLRFRSVTNGCSAKQPFFDRDVTALMTQINYNTQSSIICISVDVPPVNLCRRFVITGVVGRCVKLNEEICSDYSGSRCSGVEISDEFILGPFYVTPKAKAKAFVKYIVSSKESTTAASENTTSVYEVAPVEDDRTTAFNEHTPTFRKAAMDSTTGTEAHNIVDDTTPSNSASAASAKAATASIESITVFGEAGVEFGETTTTVRSAPTYNTADGISSSTAQSRHIVFEPTPSNNFLTVSQTIVPGRLQTNQELSFESNKDTDGGDFLQSRKIIGQRKAGILPNFDSLTKEETSTNYGRPTEQSVGTTTSLHHFLMTNEPEERGEGSSEEFDVADSDTRMETGSTQDIRMPSDSTPDTRIDTGSSPKGFIREHSTWMISDLIPTEGAIHYPALSAEISTTALNVQIQTPRYNQNEDGDWAMFEHIPAENDLPPSQLNAKVVESGADFDVG